MLAHLQQVARPLGSRAWAFVAQERLVESDMLTRRSINWAQQNRLLTQNYLNAKLESTFDCNRLSPSTFDSNHLPKYLSPSTFDSNHLSKYLSPTFDSNHLSGFHLKDNLFSKCGRLFDASSFNWTEQKRWLSASGVGHEGYRRKFDPERRRGGQPRHAEAASESDDRAAIEAPAVDAPAGGGKDGFMKKLVGLGVVGAALGKFSGGVKLLFVVLKLAKMPALLSLLASTAAYSFVFGWPWGVGMVALLLVHESGHALAMHHYRIPFSPMVFIPFMGAVVSMKEQPPDAYTNAMIALAGPVLGTLGAVGFAASGLLLDSQLLLALGSFGVTINLFNMLPIGMLDGGQIAGALSKYFLLAGWLLGLGLLVTLPNVSPIFYLVMIMSTWTTYQRFRHPPTDPSFYRITPVQRANIALGYLAVLGVLLLASATISRRLLSPKQLRAKEGGKPSDLEKSLLGVADLDKDDDEWKWAAEQDRRDRHPENRDRGRWL